MYAVTTEIYFDTNAFSDLFRNRDEDREAGLRREIRRAVRQNSIRVVTAGWTIEELGGLAETHWDIYREATEFVFAITYGLFEETSTLVSRELISGCPLGDRERFIEADQERVLRATTRRQRQLVIDSYQEHLARAKRSQSVQLDSRVDALTRVRAQEMKDGLAHGEGMRLWCTDLGRLISEWSDEYVARESHGAGLNTGAQPHPDSTTLRHFVAYSLARVCWYLRDSRRIDRGDDTDVHHYASACYTSALVTGDERMAGIVDLIPNAGTEVVTVEEFGRRYLASA